ncbi:MAG TPA: hypothetical protein VFY29_03565 [Terriglobia bacterium]|nr:hypothetical protein [Terriglobia bacterium]
MASKFKMIFGGVLRTAHTLWLEVVGSLFLAFALLFGVYAVQAYRKYVTMSGTGSIWIVGAAAFLSVLTLVFGVQSFWRARKLR